jgi:hypothetical protein
MTKHSLQQQLVRIEFYCVFELFEAVSATWPNCDAVRFEVAEQLGCNVGVMMRVDANAGKNVWRSVPQLCAVP